MKTLKTFLLVAIVLLGTCACSEPEPEVSKHLSPSKLWLPTFLSDGMVVQQNATAAFWGTTNPNATVTAEASWGGEKIETTADIDGNWKLEIPTPAASLDSYRVVIRDSHKGAKYVNDVLVGEVWHFAGQSNMEMPMRGFGSVANGNYQPVENANEEVAAAANLPHFRYFKVAYQPSDVPMNDVRENKWWRASIATEALEYSALAFFCGRKMASELNIPVGIICTPYGGTRIEAWIPASRVSTFDPADYKEASELSEAAAKKSAPGLLYNGMVHPIMPYVVRGWAWYQGESNRDNSHAYARLQQAMVDEWRKAKGDSNAQLPFYYVQISGITSNLADDYGPKLIQAQWDALDMIPNSHIITTSDVGDPDFIHYPNKKVPGERLANLILNKSYNRTDIKAAAPVVSGVSYFSDKVVVTFENGEGLHSTEATIPYVQLEDGAGKLHAAIATIKADGTMEVSSASVSSPKGVRYCYVNFHISTIYNGAGIPLAPFKHSK